MRRGLPDRNWAARLLLCAAACCMTLPALAQNNSTDTAQLLSKAHQLEVRGRIGLAKQTWQQVLLVDPNNAEALAGMARAAKSEGNQKEAAEYLRRLRAVSPNNSDIGRIESMASAQDTSAQLQEAGRLAQAGQYARAMEIQRRIYGNEPPLGDPALFYYETEAAIPGEQGQAVAGLRRLAAAFPQEPRYQIALGKVLTYNPRTRPEGRRILERFTGDPEAQEGLRQMESWNARGANTPGVPFRPSGPGGRGGRGGGGGGYARTSEEATAYRALNAKHYEEAEKLFQAILARHPHSWQAEAGLGYVRMAQQRFSAAHQLLEDAVQDGAKDPAVQRALRDSRFYDAMQSATDALNRNDLPAAEIQFQLALTLRPGDPLALVGEAGTWLRAEQPEKALPLYEQAVKAAPGDKSAWSGLLAAQFAVGRYQEALATEKRVPPKVKAELAKDPDYLRTLGSVYLALGREADAQRVFQAALNLPFPPGGQGIRTDAQLQFAALLATVHRYEQAAGLYRQVLAADPNNVQAWIGLTQAEHNLGRDADAYQGLQSMLPQVFAGAMQQAGFETTVAAIYEGAGHDDLAQDVLEKFLAKQQAEGKKPFVPAQLQLAGIYVRRGHPELAFPLYRSVLENNPGRADAWAGLLAALHSTGHDQEALAQVQQIPPDVRRELENNPNFLETVGSIYSGLGDSRQAMFFFQRVQQHYAALHMQPPADVQIQQAWMLYNSGADPALFHVLMTLGGREDLTNQQRLTVQTIWTNWAVRRANQNSAAGNCRRAIAILNAASKSFPRNPTVLRTLAGGYARCGMAKEAVLIFRTQDLTGATASDYRAAVGAALAANDLKDAEIWLRFGLAAYPKDAQMLVLAAKFEQARGDPNRAADYYRASLKAMPPEDPGAELAAELAHPAPVLAPLPSAAQPQDLAGLLGQPDKPAQQMAYRPYLPSYTEQSNMPGQQYGYPSNGAPEWMSTPQPSAYPAPSQLPVTQPTVQPNGSTLKDYVPPQSQLAPAPLRKEENVPVETAVIHLHPSREMETKYGPYVVYDPTQGVPHFASAPRALGDGVMVAAKDSGEEIVTARVEATAYTPQQPQTSQDSTPTVSYIPAARPAKQQSSTRAAAKPASSSTQSRAAAIRLNQQGGAAPSTMSGQSHPPVEDYSASQQAPSARLNNVQFSSQPYDPAQVQRGQASQPQNRGSAPAPAPQYGNTGDTYGQQYPEPDLGSNSPVFPHPRSYSRRRATRRPASQSTATAPAPGPAPNVPSAPPMNYPTAGQPMGDLGYGQQAPYQMGQPPSDYELQERNLPPLRGYYDPRGDTRPRLTDRQQAELALATIEGSYSGWAGGTAIGRYRSGRAGVDRLASLEVPIEISLVAGKSFRFSIIPKAVFLNSGQLDTTAGDLGSAPILGTLPGNALVPPGQQSASGIGGEVQIATNTFAAAIGTTPWQFLVESVIGRAQWRPANGHFLLFGGRDPVRETQLSYAGLRDPGSASAVYGGNVWGGVVATGGGARFDTGGERAGIYLQAEGAQLTGYHVLDNYKFDGTAGMYFRVNTWPEYGSLNIGGLFYGMHFAHNERAETYGLGGYFSPEAYFLAAVPFTFNGHYGTDLHYMVNTSLGVQTFQEDNQNYFPLDRALQTSAFTACTVLQLTARTCGQMPANSSTGFNYSFDMEVAYHVNDHWYVGAFLDANNTNNYNMVQGGFFARYLFKPLPANEDYPTGLFPVEGFRPLQVP